MSGTVIVSPSGSMLMFERKKFVGLNSGFAYLPGFMLSIGVSF